MCVCVCVCASVQVGNRWGSVCERDTQVELMSECSDVGERVCGGSGECVCGVCVGL